MLKYRAEIDYYGILELDSNSTADQIKKAYRKLALIHHPDKGGDQEKFKSLADAYEILLDEETRISYDLARHEYKESSTSSHSTSNDASATSSSSASKKDDSPVVHSTMVFNTTSHTALSPDTSVVIRNDFSNIASSGLKASEMSREELFNLALNSEYVALALIKDIEQLKRMAGSIGIDNKLWDLALKYPSFAYHVLAGTETRKFLYENIVYPHYLVRLIKSDYNLLVLIASSEALTGGLLFRHGEATLTGTELHEIYDFHLKQRGSCEAFNLLLESNAQLKQLFNNHEHLQRFFNNHSPLISREQLKLANLEPLDCSELNSIALKNQHAAMMIINNPNLLCKFKFPHEGELIDILLTHPECLDHFFNKPISYKFESSHVVLRGCKKNRQFLLNILKLQTQPTLLNGYELEELIQHDPSLQDIIYQYDHLKYRHNGYKALVLSLGLISSREVLNDQNFLLNIGLSEINLCDIIEDLSHKYDHKILVSNSITFIKLCKRWDVSDTYKVSKISIEFFFAIYNDASLRHSCYSKERLIPFLKDYGYELCNLSFKIFEILFSDSEALLGMTDSKIYELQQKWVRVEKDNVTKIFEDNPVLMQRWAKGCQIKKLEKGVVVSAFEEQRALNNESEAIVEIRSLINMLQQALTFHSITFDEGSDEFIRALFGEDNLLSRIVSVNKNSLPGLFWFLAISRNPGFLKANLPLDIVKQQLELSIAELKNAKPLSENWLVKQQKNNIVYLNSPLVQKEFWLNLLLDNIVVEEKPTWIQLLENNHFIDDMLDNPRHLEKLSVLNWDCPENWVEHLSQTHLINLLVYLAINYSDQSIRDQTLNLLLRYVSDMEALTHKLDRLSHFKRAEIYLALLNQGKLTLVDFLKGDKNIILLRQSDLQKYFIENAGEIRQEVFEMVEFYSKQNLLGQALTILSLIVDEASENLDDVLTAYIDTYPEALYYKVAIFIGLLIMAIATVLLITSGILPMLAIAAVGALITGLASYGLYICYQDPIVEPINITYREALSDTYLPTFFRAEYSGENSPENTASAMPN